MGRLGKKPVLSREAEELIAILEGRPVKRVKKD